MFNAEFFSNNRSELRRRLPNGLILLAAHSAIQKTADEAFAFRQESSFWYYTGIDIPDALLVIDQHGDAALILPPRDAHRDLWDGALDVDALRAASGITVVYEYRSGWAWLRQQLAATANVSTLLPSSGAQLQQYYGMVPNPARHQLLQRVRRAAPGITITSAREVIAAQRYIKQPLEVQAIEQAIAHTMSGFLAVAAARKTLTSERQAQLLLEYEFLHHGADRIAFDTIAANGINAATIHYRDNAQPLDQHNMLLIDAGAAVGYYNADITRMYAPLRGMTEQQTRYVEAVQHVQRHAESIIRPGMLVRDYEHEVVDCMGDQLFALGLISSKSDAAIRKYYPHATGHSLGLDVHDITPEDASFEPGVVFTIEPGIYNAADAIGVRIEDNYVLTHKGLQKLSESLPAVLGVLY